MTEAQQKRFYFPAWRKCAEANDWGEERRRLVRGAAESAAEIRTWPEPAREAGLQVLEYAEQLARQEHRAVTAADLRHGCNLVATKGRRSGSEEMSNSETNRVVCLFRLLSDPDNLDFVMAWLNPEESDRKSLAAFIRKQAPEATLTAIARNAYGTVFWEDLEASKLRWILGQVKGRRQTYGNRGPRELVKGPF